MKVKTALRESKGHAKFLGAILLVLLVLLAFLPSLGCLICNGLAALALAAEVINIICITGKARADPDFLEKKVK